MGRLTREQRWAALEKVWDRAAEASMIPGRGLGGIAWQALSACGTRADLPWTGDPDRLGPWDVEALRSVCASCPVLAECREFATRTHVTAGWWAGTQRDPGYVAPARPGWVKVPGTTGDKPAWQGVLPIGGAA
jgi:hypothetical protein